MITTFNVNDKAAGGGGGGSGTVTSVTGSNGITATPDPITSSGDLSLTPVADLTVMANITGASAPPTPETVSDVLDATITDVPNSLAVRGAAGWTGLPSEELSGIVTDEDGVLKYVEEFPSALIPIDNYSLVAQGADLFFVYNTVATGVFPIEMVAFRQYICVVNNLAQNVQTFAISAGGGVTSVDITGTGADPDAIVYFSIAGEDYVAITNAGDNNFTVYKWNEGLQSLIQQGSPIFTSASSPRGIAFNVISGVQTLTVAGFATDTVEAFQWNGTTFTPVSTTATGSNPGSAVGRDFAGISYFAVVNTAGASTSVYTYTGGAWVLLQTIATASSPLALDFFSSGASLYLAVACSLGDRIEVFKLTGSVFASAGSVVSAGIPVSIDYFFYNDTHYLSTVNTLTGTVDTYVYDTSLETLTPDGANLPSGGLTPADIVTFTVPRPDGGRVQMMACTNSLSNNMRVWYYGRDVISVAPIGTGEVLCNLQATTQIPRGNPVTDLLDEVFGSAQGSFIYRDAANWNVLLPGTEGQIMTTQGPAANPVWSDFAYPDFPTNFLAANISGVDAPPAPVSFSAYLDSAAGATPYSLVYRKETEWGELTPFSYSGLICDYFGVVKYVPQFPTSFIPIDNQSIVADDDYGFKSYAPSIATGSQPTQMIFFSVSPADNYISVVNVASDNVLTFRISSGALSLQDTRGTGDGPSAIATGFFGGLHYLGVTDKNASTIRFYSWDTGFQTWIAVGSDVFTSATDPAGIAFSVLSGDPTFTVAGEGSSTTLRYVWNGSIFEVAAGSTVATGAGPTITRSYTFGGTDYLCVANSGASSVSVYTFVAGNWTILQTLTTAANPVDLVIFESGANLCLAVVCKTGDTLNTFRLVSGLFAPEGFSNPANSPSGISHFTSEGVDFFAVTGDTADTIDTYIYGGSTGAVFLISSASCGGTSPSGVISYDFDGDSLTSVANSGSNTLTTFEFFKGAISLANIANNQLMANIGGGSNKPVGVGISAYLDSALGSTVGSVIARDFFSGWVALPPGASNEYLRGNGTSGEPTWEEIRGLTNFINATGIDGVSSYNIVSAIILADSAAVLSIREQTSSVYITSYVITAGNILVNFSGTITDGAVMVAISMP